MKKEIVTVRRDVLEPARRDATAFRELLRGRGIFCVHLVSSPGAGKTALLEATARHWKGEYRSAVLVGDLETDRDAQRLGAFMESVQLTTGGACHLELPLVERGFAALQDSSPEFLFIENVGNLVCPASYDLGEHLRVILLSVTEGDDKPGKYPKMFRGGQTLVLSKTDLLPHVPFSAHAAEEDARRIQPGLELFTLSALSGEGIAAWCAYLVQKRREFFNQEALSQELIS